MNERETERRLQAWLERQRNIPAPAHLQARVAAIPGHVAVSWPERVGRAVGVLPGPRARHRGPAALVLLLALAGSLGAAALFVGGPSKLTVIAPTRSPAPSPTPARSPSEAVHTPIPAQLQPMPSGDSACTTGLLHVIAGGTTPAGAATPSVPVGGRVADVALGKTDADGLAREAQVRVAEDGSISTLATITSGLPFGTGYTHGSGYAAVIGWSRDGTEFLLWAGRWSPSVWYHECADLYLVRADGSSVVRLTDNRRPGYSVWESALAPDGATVAYVEADEADTSFVLRIADRSGTTTVVDPGSCPDAPSSLAWSADGQSLAARCGSSTVLVYRIANHQSTVVNLANGLEVDRLSWTSGSAQLEASTGGPALSVVGIDPASGSSTVLQDPRRPDLSVVAFSPDGTKLLVAGCPKTPNDPACYDTELDVLEVGTGRLRSVFSGSDDEATNNRLFAARWIPDGRVAISDPAGVGTLIIDPATSGSIHLDWTLDAQLWLPGT